MVFINVSIRLYGKLNNLHSTVKTKISSKTGLTIISHYTAHRHRSLSFQRAACNSFLRRADHIYVLLMLLIHSRIYHA